VNVKVTVVSGVVPEGPPLICVSGGLEAGQAEPADAARRGSNSSTTPSSLLNRRHASS
jgi:hypothetical protein